MPKKTARLIGNEPTHIMEATRSLFISYSHNDKNFVTRLARDLKDAGANVYIDRGQIKIGESLIERLREIIDKVEYLAVVLSPSSVSSEWVKKEVDIAMNQEIEGKKVKVLPLVYQPCDLPWFLKGKLYADFSSGEKYIQSLNMVLERLNLPQIGASDPTTECQYLYHSLRHDFFFYSPSGSNAKWKKTSVFTPIYQDITEWLDRFFIGPGNLKPVETNLGVLSTPFDEGGTLVIPTSFPTPLPTSVRVTKILIVELEGTFPEDEEYITWIPIDEYSELTFHLHFPDERPFSRINMVTHGRGKSEDLDFLILKNDKGLNADISITRPIVGNKYVITWTW